MGAQDFTCPQTGEVNCMCCTGEACNLCGAGCWKAMGFPDTCRHNVLERHTGLPHLAWCKRPDPVHPDRYPRQLYIIWG